MTENAQTTDAVVHADDCYAGEVCLRCGGCDCGAVPGSCEGQGCHSQDEHDQWCDEGGLDGGCPYG